MSKVLCVGCEQGGIAVGAKGGGRGAVGKRAVGMVVVRKDAVWRGGSGERKNNI